MKDNMNNYVEISRQAHNVASCFFSSV